MANNQNEMQIIKDMDSMKPPVGKLRIWVVGGRGLEPKKSKVYVKIIYNGHRQRTGPGNDPVNPAWNEVFEYRVYNKMAPIRIQLKDAKLKPLAQLTLTGEQMMAATSPKYFTLPSNKLKAGDLQLKFQFSSDRSFKAPRRDQFPKHWVPTGTYNISSGPANSLKILLCPVKSFQDRAFEPKFRLKEVEYFLCEDNIPLLMVLKAITSGLLKVRVPEIEKYNKVKADVYQKAAAGTSLYFADADSDVSDSDGNYFQVENKTTKLTQHVKPKNGIVRIFIFITENEQEKKEKPDLGPQVDDGSGSEGVSTSESEG